MQKAGQNVGGTLRVGCAKSMESAPLLGRT
jgi:hypothetical protein